jgi:flagellar biogenesis protein FliO
MEYKVPRTALLLLLALASLEAAAQTRVGAPPAPAAPGATADDPWAAVDPEIEARPLPRHGGSATPGPDAAAPAAAARTSWLRTTLSLGGILGLIGLLAWGYRVASGRGHLAFVARGRHPGLIEVLSRATLSPRQSLCLVRVGPRLVLLGLTPDAVRALDVIPDADLAAQLAAQATRARSDSHTAEFRSTLEREARAYGTERAGLNELVTPEEERVVAVRTRLAGTIERLRSAARSA